VEDIVGLFAGVDADGFAGPFVADHPAVFLEDADEEAADLDLVDRGGSLYGGRLVDRRRIVDRAGWVAHGRG